MSGRAAAPTGRLVRLAEQARPALDFQLDGNPVRGLAGDTVLTAVLMLAPALRQADFGAGTRAGFCLMGQCQDCWIWTETGGRLRACATPLAEGMALRTTPPEQWP
jgi:D-hydroxyproline dehydrogenase subunit gamma